MPDNRILPPLWWCDGRVTPHSREFIDRIICLHQNGKPASEKRQPEYRFRRKPSGASAPGGF